MVEPVPASKHARHDHHPYSVVAMKEVLCSFELASTQKRGSDNCQLVSPYECETTCKRLEREHADFVDHSQHNRQGAIDQRAVNDDINVQEPEAQNGKT